MYLGNQQIYVEQTMEHVDSEGNKDIDLQRGYQTLDSDKALSYLRILIQNTIHLHVYNDKKDF